VQFYNTSLSRQVARILASRRRWQAQLVVLVFAALTGLSVVALVWLSEHAISFFRQLQAHWWWSGLIWTPAVTAAVVWSCRRWYGGAEGSGIPQVLSALDASTKPADRSKFVSLRLSLGKILLTSGGLLAGLSSGREGPAAQLAAGVMHHARRWLPERTRINENALIAAGGAAGVAAAFNTPLGGIMFAIEHLSRRAEHRFSGVLIAAIVLAGVVSISFYGSSPYFGTIQVRNRISDIWAAGTCLTIACGVLGGLFSKLLIASLYGTASRFNQLRRDFPVRFAAACGLVVAIIGLVSNGTTYGSGYLTTRALLQGEEANTSLYTLLRLSATWFTAWSGVPGGIFAPALSVGAGLGHDMAQWFGHPQAQSMIALGMVGFLAATTQSPITAFIIVMEMVEGQSMVLSLMSCAIIASTLARAISPPLYETLSAKQREALDESPKPTEPPEPTASTQPKTERE